MSLLFLALMGSADAGLFDALDGVERFQSGCLDVSVIADTVPYSVAKIARTTHAKTYSAIGALEQRVFPLLVEEGARSLRDYEGGAAVSAGLVNLPARPWFGVDGGVRPTLAADAMVYPDGGDEGYLKFSLLLNDPDTLTLFPYAQGAWQFHMSIMIR